MSGRTPLPGTVQEMVGLADASSYLSGRGQIISRCQAPSAPMPATSPIQMAVDFSRAQAQTRQFKACGDPRGWNFDRNIQSELYPLRSIEVADFRAPDRQFGSASRLDHRPAYGGTR